MPVNSLITDQIENKLARWAKTVDCRLFILFGSSARGWAAPHSDLDLAIDFAGLPSPRRRLQMIGQIQNLCRGRAVDVTFLRRTTNPVLRYEVFASGYPIYEAKPGLFASEAARALILYHDALPFRRWLKRRITNVKEPL